MSMQMCSVRRAQEKNSCLYRDSIEVVYSTYIEFWINQQRIRLKARETVIVNIIFTNVFVVVININIAFFY